MNDYEIPVQLKIGKLEQGGKPVGQKCYVMPFFLSKFGLNSQSPVKL